MTSAASFTLTFIMPLICSVSYKDGVATPECNTPLTKTETGWIGEEVKVFIQDNKLIIEAL